VSKTRMYRRAIEDATVKAELSSSDELKELWLNIREQYVYLMALDASMKERSLSEIANSIGMEWPTPRSRMPK
jgi:hypothetical protein